MQEVLPQQVEAIEADMDGHVQEATQEGPYYRVFDHKLSCNSTRISITCLYRISPKSRWGRRDVSRRSRTRGRSSVSLWRSSKRGDPRSPKSVMPPEKLLSGEGSDLLFFSADNLYEQTLILWELGFVFTFIARWRKESRRQKTRRRPRRPK